MLSPVIPHSSLISRSANQRIRIWIHILWHSLPHLSYKATFESSSWSVGLFWAWATHLTWSWNWLFSAPNSSVSVWPHCALCTRTCINIYRFFSSNFLAFYESPKLKFVILLCYFFLDMKLKVVYFSKSPVPWFILKTYYLFSVRVLFFPHGQ